MSLSDWLYTKLYNSLIKLEEKRTNLGLVYSISKPARSTRNKTLLAAFLIPTTVFGWFIRIMSHCQDIVFLKKSKHDDDPLICVVSVIWSSSSWDEIFPTYYLKETMCAELVIALLSFLKVPF